MAGDAGSINWMGRLVGEPKIASGEVFCEAHTAWSVAEPIAVPPVLAVEVVDSLLIAIEREKEGFKSL